MGYRQFFWLTCRQRLRLIRRKPTGLPQSIEPQRIKPRQRTSHFGNATTHPHPLARTSKPQSQQSLSKFR
jgi:hypothetical protein